MRALALTLAAALLGPLVLSGCTTDAIDPMKIQPKARAYAVSDFFDDGQTMRRPPPGTVPRERLLGAASLQTGIGPDGKPTAYVPLPVNMDMLRRGRKIFDIQCAVCHGFLGDGESIVGSKFAQRKPPSLVDLNPVPGRVFKAITDGFGVMPSYAHAIGVADRWAVSAYVQALVLSQKAEVARLPEALQRKLREVRK